MGAPVTAMNFSRTVLVSLAVLILILDLCYCDDIDRTFFKKKKEKKKEKKPSYKPYNERTFHKKNKEKVKKPSYHAPPHKPSYHPGPHPGGPIPFPITATRHFGAAVVGPGHSWPRTPHFGPFGYKHNFPY